MKNPLISGLSFALLGLIFLVIRASNTINIELSLLVVSGFYLAFKIRQRRQHVISLRSSNISIIITIIGVTLFAFNNTYAVSVLGFALLSDIILPLIFKKK